MILNMCNVNKTQIKYSINICNGSNKLMHVRRDPHRLSIKEQLARQNLISRKRRGKNKSSIKKNCSFIMKFKNCFNHLNFPIT